MRPLIPVLLGTALAVGLISRIPRPDRSGLDQTVVLADGQVIAGALRGHSFWVPQDAEVVVEGDLAMLATDFIQVDGTLRVRDRGDRGPAEGYRLELVSDRIIEVTGQIEGGQGRSFDHPLAAPGTRGGDGSSVMLRAPLVYVDGAVHGGRGGTSGPGGKGGTGGSVLVLGNARTRGAGGEDRGIFGGHGGAAGVHHPEALHGAAGGDGGNATCIAWDATPHIAWLSERAREREPRLQTASLASFFQVPPEEDPPVTPVTNGLPGIDGEDDDQHAAPIPPPPAGVHGTAQNPAGHTGSPGEKGVSAAGGDGTMGGNGANACPDGVGGDGGAGGSGGDAKGGTGGQGGYGGNGYHDGSSYIGPGGAGGKGGDGGNAKAGDGKDGGMGGKGAIVGNGGPAGSAGTATGGLAGFAGHGGFGTTTGAYGAPGSDGRPTPGMSGSAGDYGWPCDTE